MRPEEIKLFLSSFVMLFTETMAIRWQGIELPVFRACPRLILMVLSLVPPLVLANQK
jgi:hypothetical protein